jgi:hypothetical protein
MLDSSWTEHLSSIAYLGSRNQNASVIAHRRFGSAFRSLIVSQLVLRGMTRWRSISIQPFSVLTLTRNSISSIRPEVEAHGPVFIGVTLVYMKSFTHMKNRFHLRTITCIE